jgi:hypothetical protein
MGVAFYDVMWFVMNSNYFINCVFYKYIKIKKFNINFKLVIIKTKFSRHLVLLKIKIVINDSLRVMISIGTAWLSSTRVVICLPFGFGREATDVIR